MPLHPLPTAIYDNSAHSYSSSLAKTTNYGANTSNYITTAIGCKVGSNNRIPDTNRDAIFSKDGISGKDKR